MGLFLGFGIAYKATTIAIDIADKSIDKKLYEVRRDEDCIDIMDCHRYGSIFQPGAEHANATRAARDGNTAWQHSNTLWVYHPQSDYLPTYHRGEVLRPFGNGGWKKYKNTEIRGVKYCRLCEYRRRAKEKGISIGI